MWGKPNIMTRSYLYVTNFNELYEAQVLKRMHGYINKTLSLPIQELFSSKIQRSSIITLDKEQDLMSNPGEQVLLQRVSFMKVHYYGLRSQWLINSTEREKC